MSLLFHFSSDLSHLLDTVAGPFSMGPNRRTDYEGRAYSCKYMMLCTRADSIFDIPVGMSLLAVLRALVANKRCWWMNHSACHSSLLLQVTLSNSKYLISFASQVVFLSRTYDSHQRAPVMILPVPMKYSLHPWLTSKHSGISPRLSLPRISQATECYFPDFRGSGVRPQTQRTNTFSITNNRQT